MKKNKTLIIAFSGLLVAACAVLSFFSVPISNIIEIRFTVFPLAIAGYLFGPVVGGTVGAAADIVGYLVKPTGPFFPGFMLSNVVTAVIFALLLHNKPIKLWRIILAEALNVVCVGMLMNSMWLSMLYGKGFVALITARVVKELITLPIYSAALYFLLRVVSKTGHARQFVGTSKSSAKNKQ